MTIAFCCHHRDIESCRLLLTCLCGMRHYVFSPLLLLSSHRFLARWATFTPTSLTASVFVANLSLYYLYACSLSTLLFPPLSLSTINLLSTEMLFNLLHFVALTTTGVIKHKPDPNEIFSCGALSPRFGNGIKAISWAQYCDETEVDPGQNGQGATDMFAGSVGKAPVRWPRDLDNKVVIPYCYDTEEDREVALPVIRVAIDTWTS